MQFFNFMSNTIKTTLGTLFHIPHVKKLKKNIFCNGFIKKDLKLRVKNQKSMFLTLKTMFKQSSYAIF